jgi:hypothetical protein
LQQKNRRLSRVLRERKFGANIIRAARFGLAARATLPSQVIELEYFT